MPATTTTMVSALEFGNRVDAEMYRPSLVRTFNQMLRCPYPLIPLRRLCLIRSGTTPPDRIDGEQKGPILFKTTDIRNGPIPMDGRYYHISDAIHHRMSKTRLEDHDVLMNIVGATLDVIGRVAFLCGLNREANITQAMVLLRCLASELRPGYLFAFLCTRYGQDQVARFARPTGQYNLNLKEVGSIRIALLPDAQQADAERSCVSAATLLTESRALYAEAQQIFESELGLDKLNVDSPVGYTSRFSVVGLTDSYEAGRFDAQCFSPEAVFYEDWLQKHANCDRLSAVLAGTAKGRQQVEAENGSKDYCSIKHISGQEIVGASKAFASADAPIATQNDLLLAITGATIGKVGIVHRYENIVFSGDLMRLRANESISPYYLLLLLDHHISQVQCVRWITGSTNGHLAPRDVQRLLIPRLDPEIEKKVAELVAESLTRRMESEQFLEQAKAGVEQLIEEAVA